MKCLSYPKSTKLTDKNKKCHSPNHDFDCPEQQKLHSNNEIIEK